MRHSPHEATIHSNEPIGFYLDVMRVLDESRVEFLVCGTYAMGHYTGVGRATKDLDLLVRGADVERALASLAESGFDTVLAFPHWLGKALDTDGSFVDLIFSSGNGVVSVDDAFFLHAREGLLFDREVRFCPIEEMIWSKSYVMERERFDGADVAHLLHVGSEAMDWDRLLARFGAHHRVLFAHVILFGFIYPYERARIPSWVTDRLAHEALGERPVPECRVCGGTLLSREQFLSDLAGGYGDARLEDGTMTLDEIAAWTAASGRVLPAAFTRRVAASRAAR